MTFVSVLSMECKLHMVSAVLLRRPACKQVFSNLVLTQYTAIKISVKIVNKTTFGHLQLFLVHVNVHSIRQHSSAAYVGMVVVVVYCHTMEKSR